MVASEVKQLAESQAEIYRIFSHSNRVQIFWLLMEAEMSVNDIAELLNVSPKTVGHHNTRLKQKLGASNSAELTRLAIRLGLLTP